MESIEFLQPSPKIDKLINNQWMKRAMLYRGNTATLRAAPKNVDRTAKVYGARAPRMDRSSRR